MKKTISLITFLLLLNASAQRVLIVVTNHSELGNTGKKTGYYLPEVTHPFFRFLEAGLEIDFASPKGGFAPMDEKSRNTKDPLNKKFLDNPKYIGLLNSTKPLNEIDSKEYSAIVFAGGHGTMWDFKDSVSVKEFTKKIYEQGGVVAAVCHGPAALVDVKLSNGEYLIKDKRVTGFTNEEEEIVKLTKVMPFLLENKMKERGGRFHGAKAWSQNVVIDERVVTGQNPASAGFMAHEVIKLIQKK